MPGEEVFLRGLYELCSGEYQEHISDITSDHRADELIEDYKAWSNAKKKVRISSEWDYGYTASLFKYVTHKIFNDYVEYYLVTIYIN